MGRCVQCRLRGQRREGRSARRKGAQMTAGLILAVVGLAGTGKSTSADHLVKNHHFHCLYLGGVVLDAVRAKGLPVTPENERHVREEMRRISGPAVLALQSISGLRHHLNMGQLIVVDGLYSFSEFLCLEEEFGQQLRLVALHVAKNLRCQRLANRSVRPMTATEVDQRDRMEILNIEKGGPIAIADYHFINDGPQACLTEFLDSLVSNLSSSSLPS